MVKISNLFILFYLLTGCGFTSSMYKEILEAQGLIHEYKYKDAAVLYEKILKNRPKKKIGIKIHFQLGELYSIYLNKFDKALLHYEEVTQSSSDPVWQVKALEKIADIQFENKRNYKASSLSYKVLLKFIPRLANYDQYKFKYAQSQLNLKNYPQAINIFKELTIESKNQEAIDSYYNLGLINFYEKKWQKAISYWFEYLKREKRKNKIVQAKFMIANAYESSENLKEAYNIYYSIIGEYPNQKVIKDRLQSLYERRVARKR